MDEQLPTWESTAGNLLRIAQQVHVRLWAHEVGPALTSPQYALLDTVAREPEVDQRTAGERASLDKATIADVIARMVRRGWLRRSRDPEDARRNLVSLTSSGWGVLREASPATVEVQRQLMSPLPARDRTVLVDLLRKVARVDGVPHGHGPVLEVVVEHRRIVVPELVTVPGHLIRRTQQAHERLWAHEVGDRLTSSQSALLSAVAAAPSSDQRSLGELAHLDKATGAEMIARLEGRSLLSRTRDRHDGRRNLLSLTPSGERALRELMPAVRRVEAKLTEPLTAAEQERFRRLLGAIARIETPLALAGAAR